MGKIEELIEKIIKGKYAIPSASSICKGGPSSAYKNGFNQASEIIIDYLKELRTYQPEITELQAWKKIAEVTDTDEPTFNPADFYHDMRILFKNADLSVPIRGDKTLYDNGYRIVHKSSLPTQQDKVVVPVVKQFIADWYEENKQDLDYKIWAYIYDFDSQDQSEFCKWMNNRLNNPIETLIRMKEGYTVEKEQLYEVRLPFEQWDEESAELKTEIAVLAYDISSDETKFVNKGSKFLGSGYKTKLNEERIKLIDKRYWAFAVPVEEDEI